MKDKKKLFSSVYSGKGFYITAAVCLCLIAAAIGAIYKASSDLISEIAYDTNTSVSFATEQAKANKEDEADPRFTQTTTEKETTAPGTTAAPTTTKAQTTTSVPATEKETTKTDYGNKSYILPCEDEILKDYSPTPAYDETMDDWRVHKAIDFVCEKGSPVYSVGNGIVSKVYSDTSYGYCIEIDFGDFIGRYCGMEQGTTVKLDTVMKQGDTVGKTGDLPCESGQEPHFHFEVLKDGKNVDPIKELK